MERPTNPLVVIFVSYMVATILAGAAFWHLSSERVRERITSGVVLREIEQAMEGR